MQHTMTHSLWTKIVNSGQIDIGIGMYSATTSLTKSQATSYISLHMFKTLDKDIYFK